MTMSLTVAPAVRFHLSLNVASLEKSVAFYRILFGIEPAKHYADYAKFELDDPPLVLSLEPSSRGKGGVLNHLGFRAPDASFLVAIQRRLEAAGIHTQRKEGVECCYARQTKFWVTDPDATLWEIYTLEEDLEHRGVGQILEADVAQIGGAGGRGHNLGASPGPGRAGNDSPAQSERGRSSAPRHLEPAAVYGGPAQADDRGPPGLASRWPAVRSCPGGRASVSGSAAAARSSRLSSTCHSIASQPACWRCPASRISR